MPALKVAVTTVDPFGKVEVVIFALPPLRGTVPRVVDAAVNVTVPTIAAVGDVTVAVNVTDWPCKDGFSEDLIAVLVDALLTVWLRGVDVLLADVAHPLYTAVSESVPAGRFFLVSVATPLLRVAVPIEVVPFLNVTEPVGTGPTDVTVPVRTTA